MRHVPILMLLSALAVGCASPPLDTNRLVFRSFVTTALDEEQDPVEDLTTLELARVDRLYAYVTIFHLPEGSYEYRCEIYDGAGQLVEVGTMPLDTNGSTWSAWTPHKVIAGADQPGTWHFKVYLDDLLVMERRFEAR